jgi:hypothetical protein
MRMKALKSLLIDATKCYKLVRTDSATNIEKKLIHDTHWETYFKEARKSYKKMYLYANLFDSYLNLEEQRCLILKVLKPDKESELRNLKLLDLHEDARELIDSYYLAKKMAACQKIL